MPKEFACETCGKVFSVKSNLNRHVRKAVCKVNLTCEICGHVASNQNNYKRHLLKHNPETPIKCDECGKSFTTKTHLKEHIQNEVCLKQKENSNWKGF